MASADKIHGSECSLAGTHGDVRSLIARALRFSKQRGEPKPTVSAAVENGRDTSFSNDLEQLIDERAPLGLRITVHIIAMMVIALVIVAALVQVDVVVRGNGELAVDAQPIVLQPLERAVIRRILVKPGDAVKKGDALATLDSTFAQADLSSLAAQQRSLDQQVQRLEAENSASEFPKSVSSDVDPMQVEIFRQRREQFYSRLKTFDAELDRLLSAASAKEQDQKLLEQQLSIAQEVEAMRADLNRQQYTSRIQLLDSQNTRLRAERDHRDLIGRRDEIEHLIAGKKAERQAFIDEWKRNIIEELNRQKIELAKVSEALQKAGRLRQLIDLVAPDDGVVLEVASRSTGSVLREAEPLITMLPSHAALIAEVNISSRDVGYAKEGDVVRVKVDAFPYQRHGMLMGRLRSVSEVSYRPSANGQSQPSNSVFEGATHRARVELTDVNLKNLPPGARLIPGMTLSAEVKIGMRSVLSYFFDPIRRGLDESLQNPS